MTARLQLELPRRRRGGSALVATLAAALTGCGGGGCGGDNPATPVATPPPPPPPVFSLTVDTAPEPAVGIVGDSSDPMVRASLTFRFTVDRANQGERDWRIPEVSLCEEPESGGDPLCFTVTAEAGDRYGCRKYARDGRARTDVRAGRDLAGTRRDPFGRGQRAGHGDVGREL